jgi:hypothetical protein
MSNSADQPTLIDEVDEGVSRKETGACDAGRPVP